MLLISGLANAQTIEMSVVTDWETVSYYTSVEEIESVITSSIIHANNIFKDQLDIRIKMTYLDIPATEADDTIENHNHVGFLSESLIDYRNNNSDHYNADVTVLFTKRPLTTGTRNYVGYVYRLGSICTSLSVAIVKLADNGLDYLTVAHELGHVLGAAHDGEGACENEPSRGYLMSSSVYSGGITLSQCSIDAITTTLETNGGCLFEDNTTVVDPPEPPTTDAPFGSNSGGGAIDIFMLFALLLAVRAKNDSL